MANATLLRNNFEIKAFNFTQANRLESYSVMMSQLGMTSAQLIDYIQVSAASASSRSIRADTISFINRQIGGQGAGRRSVPALPEHTCAQAAPSTRPEAGMEAARRNLLVGHSEN